jgi:hypothetical protein
MNDGGRRRPPSFDGVKKAVLTVEIKLAQSGEIGSKLR